jgi:exosortase/archaeosortase family protein
VAVVANGVRVSAICLAAYEVGPQAALGLAHYSIGKTIWALALVALFAAGLLLRRTGPRPTVS